MQIVDKQGNHIHRTLSSVHRLRTPISEFPRRNFNEVVSGHDGFRESPEAKLLHSTNLNRNYFSQFEGLDGLNTKGELKELFDFLDQNVTFIDTFDDKAKPVTYGVIPFEVYKSMEMKDFHYLLEKFANNPALRRYMAKKHNIPNTGIVQFMIDDSHKTLDEGPIGLDYQKFEQWQDPDKHRVVQLGATGRNDITLTSVDRFAPSWETDDRQVLLASDGRVAINPETGSPVYIHSTSQGVARDKELRPMDFRIRQLLNGQCQPEVKQTYFEEELDAAHKAGTIPRPVDGEPLSLYLLDRTTPELLREGQHFIFNASKKAFIDQRPAANDYDEEVRRLALLNQLTGRIGEHQNYKVRTKNSNEQTTATALN